MIDNDIEYLKAQIREVESMLLPLSSRKPVDVDNMSRVQLEEKYNELSKELDDEIYGGLY